jgi:muramoyltetrapeptide carboxypeptidase
VAHLPHLTPAAREDFFRWLSAPGPRQASLEGLTVVHGGQARGLLAGGNLTTLCHLLGTPYAPRFAGYVLFLEDHNEALYRLDRMVHHLLFSGALEGVRGVVLGAFTNCDGDHRVPEVLGEALAPLQAPVLAGLPVGHQPDNYTLPLGAPVLLDGDSGCLTFLEAPDS